MPPKTQKIVAYRRQKLPVRRAVEDSPPSPSPPARKRRAATTPEARAKKLQKEGLLPSKVTEVTPAPQHVSSSSSSLPMDPMATTSSSTDSSSPINEENILDKVDCMVDQATQMESWLNRGTLSGKPEPNNEMSNRRITNRRGLHMRNYPKGFMLLG